MTISLSPPWQDLTFMTALSEARAARLVAFLTAGSPGVVLDVGCGWAELLLRVLAASPTSTGIGVDSDAEAVERGRQLARARGLADRVTLLAADASTAAPETADAVICVGATHAWAPPAGPDDPLHYLDALRRIRTRLPRGGRLVYGEGIWSTAPTPAATAALGGRDDELVPLAGLVDLATQAGYVATAVHEATLDEWDTFESGYAATWARWLAGHEPDHPDAPEVRARAARQRDRYFSGYRGVLGLAYLELVAV